MAFHLVVQTFHSNGNLQVALKEKSGGGHWDYVMYCVVCDSRHVIQCDSHWDLWPDDHEYLYKISWQAVQ